MESVLEYEEHCCKRRACVWVCKLFPYCGCHKIFNRFKILRLQLGQTRVNGELLWNLFCSSLTIGFHKPSSLVYMSKWCIFFSWSDLGAGVVHIPSEVMLHSFNVWLFSLFPQLGLLRKQLPEDGYVSVAVVRAPKLISTFCGTFKIHLISLLVCIQIWSLFQVSLKGRESTMSCY